MMRRILMGLAAASCGMALAPGNAVAAERDLTPYVVGAGAIVGVLGFNVLALGAGAVPAAGAYAGIATVPAEASVAMSRVYAVSSAVAGGLLADYYYGGQNRLFAAGSGALLGVTAFNILSAPWGTVPLAGAALAGVPVSVALGSRMLAVASAGAGAAAALWEYDRETGRVFPARYVASLAAGALAGVAGANLLSAGTVGTLPYFVGSGAVAGELATAAAQAASRVYVVGAGVLGALAGDYVYRAAGY